MNYLRLFRNYSTKKASTIDKNQMKIFDELSKLWWDKSSIMSVLHDFHEARMEMLRDRLPAVGLMNLKKTKPMEGLTVLDVGCGGGILPESFAEFGCKVVGIDSNKPLIDIAKERAKKYNFENLEYHETTIEEHCEKNFQKYDVVICSEVIEHVANQDFFVECTVKCLKPKGSIFYTTNSKTWISKFIFITVYEHILRALPIGSHEYDKFIDIKDLEALLKKNQCDIVFTCGVVKAIFGKKWYLSDNPNLINYVLHGVKKA